MVSQSWETLIVLRGSGKVFCGVPLDQDLSDSFSKDSGIWGCKKEDHKSKMPFSSHPIILTTWFITVDVKFDHLLENRILQVSPLQSYCPSSMPLIPDPYCSLQTKLFAKPHTVKE